MYTRGGTVLVLVLSWGLASVPQCSSTNTSETSTCWVESSLETQMKPWDIQIEFINWERLKLDMLKKLRLYRNLDYIYLARNIIVDKNFQYCQYLSLGFRMEKIEAAKNAAHAVIHNMTYQLLTDIVNMGNLSYVRSTHNRALLDDIKLSSLLGKMSIITNLNSKDLSHNLRILSLQDKSYVNTEIQLVCQANLFMQGHHSKMIRFKKGWGDLWLEIFTLEDLIYGKKGQNRLGDQLSTCLKLGHPND